MSPGSHGRKRKKAQKKKQKERIEGKRIPRVGPNLEHTSSTTITKKISSPK